MYGYARKGLILLFIFWARTVCGSAGEKAALQDLIPEWTEEGKWQRHLDSEVYKGDELYLYINGGAEIYYEYGFNQVILQDYINPSGKSLSLEIFEMHSPESAFGIYTFKSSSSGEGLDIGNGGRIEGYYLNFWKDSFLITITGFDEDEETVHGLKVLAKAVESKIPSIREERKPPLINFLPEERFLDGSLKYYKGHLGLFNNYPFSTSNVFRFKDGVSGEYEDGTRIFILAYAEAEESNKKFQNAQSELKGVPRYREFTVMDGAFIMVDENDTSIFVMYREQHILIVMGWSTLDEAREITERIALQ